MAGRCSEFMAFGKIFPDAKFTGACGVSLTTFRFRCPITYLLFSVLASLVCQANCRIISSVPTDMWHLEESNSSNTTIRPPLSKFIMGALTVQGTVFTNFSSTSMQKSFESAVKIPIIRKLSTEIKYQILGWCSLTGVICEIPHLSTSKRHIRKRDDMTSDSWLPRLLRRDGAVVYFALRRVDEQPLSSDVALFMNATEPSPSYLTLFIRSMRSLNAPIDSAFWLSPPRYCEKEGAGACNVTAVISKLRESTFELSLLWASTPTFDLAKDSFLVWASLGGLGLASLLVAAAVRCQQFSMSRRARRHERGG